MPEQLGPAQRRLWPFYVPTLFQSLSQGLGDALTPIASRAMLEAFARGQAIGSLFAAAGRPTDTAVVLDLPGAESVAAAAGLSDAFDPVFTFDNWPHPRGVVPAERTLAAAIYYRPLLIDAHARLAQPAPPAFVLDAARLAPYVDAEMRFDNRYRAKLPSAEWLAQLGVRHVLYVTAEPTGTEAEDLNGFFADYAAHGIDVKLLAMSDFAPDADEAVVARPLGIGLDPYLRPLYFFGGNLHNHRCFWHHYGWYPVRGPIESEPPLPVRIAVQANYRPTLRPSFWHPVGRVTVTELRATGEVTNVRFGAHGLGPIARSGSLGRVGSGGGG
jgi:hypothetical protein